MSHGQVQTGVDAEVAEVVRRPSRLRALAELHANAQSSAEARAPRSGPGASPPDYLLLTSVSDCSSAAIRSGTGEGSCSRSGASTVWPLRLRCTIFFSRFA